MEEPYSQMMSNGTNGDAGFSVNGTWPNMTVPGIFPSERGTLDIRVIIYWVIFSIAFPGICFALCKLSQKTIDQIFPVYVINLLISDLIQVCCNAIQMTVWHEIGQSEAHYVLMYVFYYGVELNVFLMVCISAERYVMIAHAVWYRNTHTRKVSAIISVVIWMLSGILLLLSYFTHVMAAILLLPYPLVLFFFVATWRALSRSSVPRNDQIRIRSILGLVLFIYTVLFLPWIITMVDPAFDYDSSQSPVYFTAEIFVAINPLFDLLLYVFMRRDVKDDLRALLFCVKKTPEVTSATQTATV